MRKTDKKIDNALIKALTDVCDAAQQQYAGFEWLTHFANYNNFPGSLLIVCVFDTNERLKKTDKNAVCTLISEALVSMGITLKDARRHVDFDTEENCTREQGGSWNERFKQV